MNRRGKTYLTAILVILLIGIFVASCSSPSPTPAPAPAPTSSAPAPTPKATTPTPSPSPTATAAPTIGTRELTVASLYAANVDYAAQLTNVFADKVKELSGGKMTVKIFAGGVLGKADVQSQTVGTGRADIGVACAVFEVGKFPYLEGLTMLPDFFGEYKYFSPVLRAQIGKFPELQAEFTKNNVQYLYSQFTASYHLFTRKPVASIEAAKGLLIRASGGVLSQMVEAIGLTPVSMASGETYLALQKGTVDGTFGPSASVLEQSINEVAPYAIEMGQVFNGCPWLINLDTWKKMNKAEQDILIKAGIAAEQNYLQYMLKTDSQLYQKLKDAGVKWTKASPESLSLAKKQMSAVGDKWVAKMGDTAKKMLDFAKDYQTRPPTY